MKRSVLVFLFLALAMTVMAAPSKKPRTICSKVNKSALLAKAKGHKSGGTQSTANGGTRGVSSAGASPAQGAAAKKVVKKKGTTKRDLDSDSDLELFTRASETSLCGISIRGSSSRMCQGNYGYFKDDRGTYGWYGWETFKNQITSANVPSRFQCDHVLELQMTVRALTDYGFCDAWTAMEKAWKKLDPRKDVKKAMKDEFVRGGSLKETANSLSMLHYVNTSFNEYKRGWVAALLRGAPQASSTKLKGYIEPSVSSTVDAVAVAIDNAAYNLLDRINALATPPNFDWETATEEQAAAVCALDDAQLITFQSSKKPVKSYWDHMKTAVHG